MHRLSIRKEGFKPVVQSHETAEQASESLSSVISAVEDGRGIRLTADGGTVEYVSNVRLRNSAIRVEVIPDEPIQEGSQAELE